MRIALVAPFGLRAKGTGRARALPLGRALARRGHQVALFVPPYDGAADSGLCWPDGGVAVINVRLPAGFMLSLPPLAPLWQLVLAWRLVLAVRAWRPEVVHVFKPKGPSGLAGVAFWLLRDRLVIDTDDWEGPGGWNDDPRAGYSALQRRFFAWQERFGLSHARAWTSASRCLRRRAIDFGATQGRVFLLPNGIDEDPLPAGAALPADRQRACEGLRVLLYTRFAGVRVAAVVGIWRQVIAACPAARLTVVGQGLAGEENELVPRMANVELAGWLQPTEMPALFARMCLAIVPWTDTPANQARNSAKVLELMAAGLPMVAYAVGELPATVGGGAVLVPPADEMGFVRAVVGLLNAPERAVQLGAEARRRVLAEYTWDKLVERALEAYERTMT